MYTLIPALFYDNAIPTFTEETENGVRIVQFIPISVDVQDPHMPAICVETVLFPCIFKQEMQNNQPKLRINIKSVTTTRCNIYPNGTVEYLE